MFAPAPLVHTEVIPIRWGDMDAMGHVNNTVYFRYMEQARIGLFDRFELSGNSLKAHSDIGPVVVTSACTFRRAITYPGTVEVRIYVVATGRASVTLGYELRPSYDPEVIYADGTSKGCWIDLKQNKSVALPEAVRRLASQSELPQQPQPPHQPQRT